MFISPRFAYEQGWLVFPEGWSEAQINKAIQPNAVDFTVDRMFEIMPTPGELTESTKVMRVQHEMHPTREDDPSWSLTRGVYDIMSNYYVDLPNGVAAYIVTRSSLVRNGLMVYSGLYDSGFKGNVGGVITNMSGPFRIGKGTRVGQLVFVKSDESNKLYAGGYNTTQGTHWSQQTKE